MDESEVLTLAHTAAFADLYGLSTRDHVARPQVLGRRRVPLHEALTLGVALNTVLATRAVCDAAPVAVNARELELHTLTKHCAVVNPKLPHLHKRRAATNVAPKI